jgi:hypothetical protein
MPASARFRRGCSTCIETLHKKGRVKVKNRADFLKRLFSTASLAVMPFLFSACGGDCLAPGGCNSGASNNGSTLAPAPASATGTYTVLYVVSGSAKQASLTYNNSQGGTAQQTVNLPWQTQFTMKKGDFLYISAQNQADVGSVVSEIKVDGNVFKSTISSGAFVIATASGSCC